MSTGRPDLLSPAASPHLPFFITAPGDTDVLMVVMGAFLVLAILGFGILFLRLHSLPDQIAHRSHKLQAEIVCVLCLISLLTSMHIFWIIALLLAVIDLPDFGTPLNRIAGSTERIAGLRAGEGVSVPDGDVRGPKVGESSIMRSRPRPSGHGGVAALAPRPETEPAKPSERLHA